ncbi:MAG TPA: hypothetical protein C5S37_05875 [Methanophagales archaeon]|nr:hypothetical protein [Methanophagales archaeon]
MGGKLIDALKCFIKCPMCTMRLTLGSYEPITVELIKESCPEVEVESLGYYFGILLAIIFLILCVTAYILQLFTAWV